MGARRNARGRRRRLLALVHIGKKALGLDDEGYRELLREVTGCASAADLDDNTLQAVVDVMRAQGFSTEPSRVPRYAAGERPHNFNTNPQYGKIEALLLHCGLGWRYAHGIAGKMFAGKRLEHCASDELRAVIAALEKHKARHSAGASAQGARREQGAANAGK